MPLPPPAPRNPIHTRTIECRGYERADGLWDIEGHLTDVKHVDLDGDGARDHIPAGALIHNMWIRLTIDIGMNILDVHACTDDGPYPTCGDITPNFRRLIGLNIGPGWQKAVRGKVGGTAGCVHMVNLLGPVANTAYQATVIRRLEREKAARAQWQAGRAADMQRPYQLGSCHIYSEGSPASRARWPQFYPDE